MSLTTHLITADDLWNMPGNGEGYELVNGELRPTPLSGQDHSCIGADLASQINVFVKTHKLGKVTGADGGYLIAKNPDTVRAPDIGFVQTSRLPNGKTTKKYFPSAPDLAVEIISPNDIYEEVDDKVKEFLDAGTRLVWVVNPRRKSVTIATTTPSPPCVPPTTSPAKQCSPASHYSSPTSSPDPLRPPARRPPPPPPQNRVPLTVPPPINAPNGLNALN